MFAPVRPGGIVRRGSAGGAGSLLHQSILRETQHDNVEDFGMATGTVKWFNDDKGFGFITPDEAGKDLFVHHTAILADGFRTLPEGARVEYEAQAGDKGPKAVNVRRV
jgi:cold shock protein